MTGLDEALFLEGMVKQLDMAKKAEMRRSGGASPLALAASKMGERISRWTMMGTSAGAVAAVIGRPRMRSEVDLVAWSNLLVFSVKCSITSSRLATCFRRSSFSFTNLRMVVNNPTP
jgi:hypothetical protein